MPTRMHLEILVGTAKFHKLFTLESATSNAGIYTWRNRYGRYKYVFIIRTSLKCYRVFYMNKWSVEDISSEYHSFRTLLALCDFLDTLV